MNATQKKKVLKIVAGDCLITGRNINHEGETCVVGALALAAGVSQRSLSENYARGSILDGNLKRLRLAIRKAFGIEPYELRQMQVANDQTPTVNLRRIKVAAVVRSLPVSPG